MNVITGARLRRLIPVGGVAAVLAVAYMAPLPAEASKLNNCGVKAGYAYAYHDHGKPCPNRPFPGMGNGVLRIFGLLPTATDASAGTTTHTNGKVKSKGDLTTTVTNNIGLTDDADGSAGSLHGRGHGQHKSHDQGKNAQ